MILFTVAVVLLVLLSGLSLITGAEFEAEVKAARSWLAGLVVPARAVRTSARRMPSPLEKVAAAGGAPGTVRAWSSPAMPGAVPLPLDYVPPGWTRDQRAALHPPAPRHGSTEPRVSPVRVTERTVPRKQTQDHAPWETDHFAIVRPEPYAPEMTR